MQHIDVKTMRDYQQGLLSAGAAAQVEEHLAECELCMEAFLAGIDAKAVEHAAQTMAADFTDRVMQAIRQEAPIIRKPAQRRKSRNLMTYYAAAAAVTLLLMGNGFFQGLVEKVPMATVQAEQRTTEINLQWPDHVVTQAAKLIQDFETGERGSRQDAQ